MLYFFSALTIIIVTAVVIIEIGVYRRLIIAIKVVISLLNCFIMVITSAKEVIFWWR